MSDDGNRIELGLEWEAEYVEPDTLSDEDPTKTIPVGWWVFGYNADDNREAELYVRGIYDAHGNDVSEQVARLLADKLNEVSAQ